MKPAPQHVFYALLIASLGFFLYKGLHYALLGSWVPLLFILLILSCFGMGWRLSTKVLRRVLRLWATLLILWSVARLLIPLSFWLTPGITETHIRDQFTVMQYGLTLAMLLAGTYLLRQVGVVWPAPGNLPGRAA